MYLILQLNPYFFSYFNLKWSRDFLDTLIIPKWNFDCFIRDKGQVECRLKRARNRAKIMEKVKNVRRSGEKSMKKKAKIKSVLHRALANHVDR